MSESEEGQSSGHEQAYELFLALEKSQRHALLAIPYTQKSHVSDEVVLMLALESEKCNWPDKKKYLQALIDRCYVHVRAHVHKNPQLQRRGGGIDAVTDDAANYFFEKLLSSKSDQAYGKRRFGNLIHKRFLDFVDTYYSNYHKNKVENNDDDHEVDLSAEIDDEAWGQEGYVESLAERLKQEAKDDERFKDIRILLEDPAFLSENERIAFVLHSIGDIQIFSKFEEKITVCKLMKRSDKQVRLYIKDALNKLKKKLT